jgi:DNA repair exonuclease SbcCD ATPase subunit
LGLGIEEEEVEIEEDLHRYISTIEGSKISSEIEYDRLVKLEQEITLLTDSIHTKSIALEKKRATLASLEKEGDVSKLEGKMSLLMKKATSISHTINDKRAILDNYAEYEVYLALAQEIYDLDVSIDDVRVRLKQEEYRLDGMVGLGEAEKEVETIALQETVNSINEHAKIYLDQMFEDPIVVRLECTKDTKTGGIGSKIKLNTYIDYKLGEYSKVEELSGGELQRCELAFVLAVNDMVGSDILIFDESFNEMDQTINANVLSLVRDMCYNKLVLVVSHEAIRGIFDTEITVG